MEVISLFRGELEVVGVVRGDSGAIHVVQVDCDRGVARCTCQGFTYSSAKRCKHIDLVVDLVTRG